MSAPWWHPEANQRQDIRNIKLALELGVMPADLEWLQAEAEMAEYEAEAEAVLSALLREPLPPGPYWVRAPCYRHALYWAGKRGLPRSAWRFVQSWSDLLGVRSGTCVLLNEVPANEERLARVLGLQVVREST